MNPEVESNQNKITQTSPNPQDQDTFQPHHPRRAATNSRDVEHAPIGTADGEETSDD